MRKETKYNGKKHKRNTKKGGDKPFTHQIGNGNSSFDPEFIDRIIKIVDNNDPYCLLVAYTEIILSKELKNLGAVIYDLGLEIKKLNEKTNGQS